MARYRKIETRIWCDERFRVRPDDEKLVFLMLLSHPDQTSIGAFRATPNSLATMLRWPEKRFGKAFDGLLSSGMAEYDREGLVWLPKFLRYNAPENGNVVRSWLKFIDLMPPCPLLNRIIGECQPFAEGFGIPFTERFGKWKGDPQNPEPRTQNPTKDINPGAGETVSGTVLASGYTDDFEEWWKHYPKKTGKRAAYVEWQRACKRAESAVLLEAVIRFAASDKANGKFCWDPRTWLHQGHWEDDPETWKERRNGGAHIGPGQRSAEDATRVGF